MPSLGMMVINALYAADSVLIPVQPQYYATDGLTELLKAVKGIKQRYNPKLEIGDMEVSLLIPFTESVDVINDIRGMVHNNVSLIAKIETESGMNNIEEIARKAEGILIGRGDLALYSNLKDLFPNLRDAIEKVRENKIIFCTGILQNFSDAYMPERAEIFDLMLIKQLYANELILSGSSDFNFSNIRELYLHSLKSIKRKVGFINNVW